MGYLVWDEFPNWGLDYKRPEVNQPVVDEWREIMLRDRNHPAVIGWCPFNETPAPAAPLQKIVFEATRALDPSRPVIESSGYYHGVPNPQVLDAHDYDQNPASFRARWSAAFGPGPVENWPKGVQRPDPSLPFFVSEYAGIGWNIHGGWGYGKMPQDLEAFYTRFQGLTDALLDNGAMFGYCYTQLTDIEQEQNGLYTYDRQPKFDVQRLRAIQSRAAAYEKVPPPAGR
jgi:hypothetical protein